MNNILNLLPIFKAVRSSLQSGESFTFAIEGFCPLRNFSVYLDVAKVEADNDEWVASISPSSIEYTEKGFNLHIDKFKNFEPGRYLIKAGIVPPGKPVPFMSFSKQPTDFGASIFEIRDRNEPESSHDDLFKDYENLLKARTENFLKGFGEQSTPETQNYLALVFVKNCLLTKRMRLGQYELIPLEGLGCIDIANLINQFLHNSNLGVLDNLEETLSKAKQGQPTIVAHFPKVVAKDPDSAGKIVEGEINILKDLLSIHRNSYAEIVGCVLINMGARQMYYRIITPNYRGNLLGGDIAGEFPRTIIKQMEKVRENSSLQLYAALYKEALKETKTEFAYFRFWNLIETIARSKNYIGRPLKDWQGNIKKTEETKIELLEILLLNWFLSCSEKLSHWDQQMKTSWQSIWHKER